MQAVPRQRVEHAAGHQRFDGVDDQEPSAVQKGGGAAAGLDDLLTDRQLEGEGGQSRRMASEKAMKNTTDSRIL